MNQCFQEICEVKHLVKCTKEDNIKHTEELNFIEMHGIHTDDRTIETEKLQHATSKVLTYRNGGTTMGLS